MGYDLKEDIKHQIDSIRDYSFLEAIRVILATKYPVASRRKKNNYQLWVDLTAQYGNIDEAEIDVDRIYQNRLKIENWSKA